MGCYIEFLILKEKILEIAGEEISMPVTVTGEDLVASEEWEMCSIRTTSFVKGC